MALAFATAQAALLVFCEFGPIGPLTPYHSDIAVPEGFARRMLAGETPYRDFVVEYPPLALPFFWLAGWLGPSSIEFTWFFAAEVLLFHSATLLLVSRANAGRELTFSGQVEPLGWFLAFSLGLWPVMLTRYDAIPTFFAFGAVAAWKAGRPVLAGVAGGLGVLIKLFPGFVLLPQVAREWRSARSAAGRLRAGLAATMALGLVAWVLLGRSGVWASIEYHSNRRIEVEALSASLIFLADALLGRRPLILHNYGAFHLMGDLPDLFALLSLPLLGFTLFLLWMQARTNGDSDSMRVSCGYLLAFVVTNKVLSPQYLIWLIPFIASLTGRRAGLARLGFAVVCVLTTLGFPYFFAELVEARPLAVAILAARNAILVLIAVVVWSPDPGPVRRP